MDGVWGHSRGDRECKLSGWDPFASVSASASTTVCSIMPPLVKKQDLDEDGIKEDSISSGSKNRVAIVDKTQKSSSSKRRFGRLAESAARENLVGDHGFNDDEVKLVGTGVSAQ